MNTRKVAGVVSVLSLMLLLAVVAAGLVSAAPPNAPPGLARAIAAQERHTDALLAKRGVVGTAVGLAADGTAVVKVYTKSSGVHGIPADLDGVEVEEEETGELVAQTTIWNGIGGSSGTERLIVYRRGLYCTVGTLGVLVKDVHGVVYALSNAHVYASEGSKISEGPAVTGVVAGAENADRILAPGRVDMQPACGNETTMAAATIGTLWNYQPIVFSRTADNRIDAAIAKLEFPLEVANATPDSGYGTPSSAWDTAGVNDVVVKYGRTTGQTQGKVTGVNASLLIKYDIGQARFNGQVVVTGSSGAFSAGGDSGSLIVRNSDKRPVALLFAGSSSTTIGNPIKDVLAAFGVTIVGN
jgi:hypothetical protein